MALQDSNNIVENMVNTQKQVFDTIVENTKKFTTGIPVVNETIEKGADWYKNWLETQKNMFAKTTEKATQTTETVKETVKDTTAKMNEFYENWFKMQMEGAKKIWEMANSSNNAAANHTNPFTAFTNQFGSANPFTNGHNPMTSWQNNMNNMNNFGQWTNWMNQAQNMNPFNNETFKKPVENMTNMFTQYFNTLSTNFGDWQKNFNAGSPMDAYKNMVNTGLGFSKFAELWAPMFKSIQDKTFNMDTYKQMVNPELYKEMMDKYLGLLPEGSREQMQNMGNMMKDGMKQFSEAGMNGYQQMRDMMNQASGSQSHVFGDMLNGYNNWYSKMNEAAGPFNKLVTANKYTKAMAEWNDITNRIVVYNIKNAELQYMIYNQGQKVMDALAENVAKKVKEGTEVKSMLGLYQEWLNISDKVFVNLFESDEYSKLMAEVGALQMKIRRDIDLQTEKSLGDLPIAKRSELDELYKTIHDLKMQVRELSKAIAQKEVTPAVAPVTASADTTKETDEEKATTKASKKA